MRLTEPVSIPLMTLGILLASSGASSSETEGTGRIVIAFMGDTMLGRLVSEQIPRRDPAWFWGTTLPLVKECDLRILNLETTITTKNTKWTEWRKAFYYRAVPQAVDVLKAAGVEYVNLANNHVLDFSEPGLKDTIAYLDRAGIGHTGAGFSPEDAARPAELSARDTSIGVFSFADHYDRWDASKRGAGVFLVSIPPTARQWERIQRIVHQLDEQHDLVVLSVHWGPNMRGAPSKKVVELAHRLIDEGVDVIHGHSAHVFHGVEIYKGKVILYDTGEFIDDYAIDRTLRNDYSFLYRLTLESNRPHRLELIPVVIDRMQVNVARGRDLARIFELFEQRTRRFDTPYEIDGSRILIPFARADQR